MKKALALVVLLVAAPAWAGKCPGLAKKVERWQARLSLTDWTVDARCEMHPEYGDSVLGAMEAFLEAREVTLWVTPTTPVAEQESVVAHELLHVWVEYAAEADSVLVEEQAVRAIENALFEAPPPTCVAAELDKIRGVEPKCGGER